MQRSPALAKGPVPTGPFPLASDVPLAPTARQTELSDWLAQQRDRQEAVGTLPTRVRSFLKDVEALDTRRAKALLQTILSAAHVYRDGRIEFEFLGQHT